MDLKKLKSTKYPSIALNSPLNFGHFSDEFSVSWQIADLMHEAPTCLFCREGFILKSASLVPFRFGHWRSFSSECVDPIVDAAYLRWAAGTAEPRSFSQF
jgi:hypothetical protein